MDDPPSRHRHWRDVEIDWEAGKVLDDFDYTEEGRPFAQWRVLLIHQVALKHHWLNPVPQPSRLALQGARDLEQKKRGRRPVKRKAVAAEMTAALKSGKHTLDSLHAATEDLSLPSFARVAQPFEGQGQMPCLRSNRSDFVSFPIQTYLFYTI